MLTKLSATGLRVLEQPGRYGGGGEPWLQVSQGGRPVS